MQIDLPHDVAIRVQRHHAAGIGDSDSDVTRKALDAMDWIDQPSKPASTPITRAIIADGSNLRQNSWPNKASRLPNDLSCESHRTGRT